MKITIPSMICGRTLAICERLLTVLLVGFPFPAATVAPPAEVAAVWCINDVPVVFSRLLLEPVLDGLRIVEVELLAEPELLMARV